MKRVQTINDEGDIPAGSTIVVEKELKYHYRGSWSSYMGTYQVKVKKSNCRVYRDPYKKIINAAITNPANEKKLAELKKLFKKLYP